MIVIAGPCSIESSESFALTAGFLKGMGVQYIRGGSMKYRSDPSTYQGTISLLGDVRELKKRCGFKLVTEIFKVDKTVKHYIDMIDVIQVGSRNMMNTTLLKDISENFPDKIVMLKRHYSSSLKDFVMHTRYLQNPLWLCLRGIQSFHPQEQRFFPDITDIARLKKMTDHKIIYDVSHPACRSEYVPDLIRAAMIYEPYGLMVEVHPNPPEALSDPDQQLDFDQFKSAMKGIL